MAARHERKIALLTNFLPPYRIKVLQLLRHSVKDFRIFVSVEMESNRRWAPDPGPLPVTVQHTLSFPSRVVHPGRFEEQSTVHWPYDTLPQLIAYRPDAIISAEFGMRTVQAALYKCLAPRTKLIVWATLSEVTERYRGGVRRLMRRLILNVIDGVLVNGSSGAAYIESLGFGPERIYIVPQATDNDLFAGPPFRPVSPVRKLLFTGQLIERKGLGQLHEQLTKWCELHPQRQICWTIVGTGPLRETIQAWNRPPNYDLRLLEEVPFRELAAHYHQADIFVFPSLADEWGLVVNEAMIAGLPVLGSVSSQAVEDLVHDGSNGWRFHPEHPEDLYRALDRALNCSTEALNTMRSNAINTARRIDSLRMRDLILDALEAACS